MIHFHALNFISVIVATIIYFMLGAVWYSPIMFSKAWASMQQIDMNDKSRMPLMLSLTFVLNFIISIAVALLVSVTYINTFVGGAKLGFLIGCGIAATTMGINYLYGNRPFKLYVIDATYHVLGITLTGIVAAVWH
jgi:hypothetical protein